ncbi:MAG: hypothetical protein ACREOZ_04365, partial [Gloeomargaritales cyanobacterium]
DRTEWRRPRLVTFLPIKYAIYPITHTVLLAMTMVFILLSGHRVTDFNQPKYYDGDLEAPPLPLKKEPPDPAIDFAKMHQEIVCATVPGMQTATLGICMTYAMMGKKCSFEGTLQDYHRDYDLQYLHITRPCVDDNFFELRSERDPDHPDRDPGKLKEVGPLLATLTMDEDIHLNKKTLHVLSTFQVDDDRGGFPVIFDSGCSKTISGCIEDFVGELRAPPKGLKIHGIGGAKDIEKLV